MTVAYLDKKSEDASKLDRTLAELREKFSKTAAHYDSTGTVPVENFEALREKGLLALTIPVDRGGMGGGLATAAKVIREIAQGEPSTALILAMQYMSLTGMEGLDRWPKHIRLMLEQRAISHGALANALRVEPELGTPARGGLPATLAERKGDGWVITGRKIFSTGSYALDYMLVWARTDDDRPSVGYFLVPKDEQGVRIEESWNHLGMRATASHDVVLEKVKIPADHAVDIRQPADWQIANDRQTSWMAVLLGALYDGIAQSARDWFIHFAQTRTPSNLGAALSTLPRFQDLVGRIDALLLANRALLKNVCECTDNGAPQPTTDALLMKYLVTKNAIDAVSTALESIGNPGLTRHNELERHYRNVLCSRAHAPQNDSILIAAGRSAFDAAAQKLNLPKPPRLSGSPI
ncbi:MAG: acyl-CoA dehydrogenase [Mesorhizobium sp.]|uniref:acyl-CoA dehydrogenase family protein n=1 Tax=Mesorhizobium sp. TaxID=1871066 RepID=UPI000FE928A1|nr:acyl-CoA dehydrogenase family protein [Mesorhizobium sp.]RWB32199.1 MAG: acyl-CoA dehydrogenase [Mesorhizobium sp.]RWB81797.1 MAG: acyl-CoA dehydrogenase [Mesorhizobium sp.]RWF77930.1 MAG: acyl-CoA dehydrogenase [Mesorhizobium sp.]TIS68511.1 MAG: acyl-CoA dehydrogenase [Mesorhizobium sp.]TIW51067.1 MAG: acyl-CoA dehydrogenase [Mesorhizobium sp.]